MTLRLRFCYLPILAGLCLAPAAFGQSSTSPPPPTPLPPPTPKPPPASSRVPSGAPELAAELIGAERRFLDAVQQDLGDTSQGRRLTALGNTLLGVSERFRDVTDNTSDTMRRLTGTNVEQRRWLEFTDVERALGRVQDALVNPPNTTPTAGPVADRLGELVRALRRVGFGQLPAVVLPADVPTDRLLRLSLGVADENRQMILFLRDVMPPSPAGNQLRLYAERLSGKIRAFRHRVATSAEPPQTLRLAFQPVREEALVMNELVARANAFPTVAQHWVNMRDRLARMEDAIGVSPDFPVPREKVPEKTPEGGLRTITQLPAGPAPEPGEVNPEAVKAADRALSLLDSYQTTLTPSAGKSEYVTRLLTTTRELHDNVARFRAGAAAGVTQQRLRELLAAVSSGYNRFRTKLGPVVREDPALDSFQVHELDEALQWLRRTLP